MFNNKMFTMVAAAGLMLAGLQAQSHAQCAAAKLFASDNKQNLIATLQVATYQGRVAPLSTYYFTDGRFNVNGMISSLDVEVDADGTRHAIVDGFGYFYVGRTGYWSHTQANLTLTPNGASSVGVIIEDMNTHQTLYATNAELPVFQGAIYITPAGVNKNELKIVASPK